VDRSQFIMVPRHVDLPTLPPLYIFTKVFFHGLHSLVTPLTVNKYFMGSHFSSNKMCWCGGEDGVVAVTVESKMFTSILVHILQPTVYQTFYVSLRRRKFRAARRVAHSSILRICSLVHTYFSATNYVALLRFADRLGCTTPLAEPDRACPGSAMCTLESLSRESTP
jgi:hypothetical protein